jgi:hypothetical protein
VLVPVNSATDKPPKDHRQRYHVLPIKQNHSNMVKFSSRWDGDYRLIASHLKEFSAAATEALQARYSVEGKLHLFKIFFGDEFIDQMVKFAKLLILREYRHSAYRQSRMDAVASCSLSRTRKQFKGAAGPADRSGQSRNKRR